MTDPHIRKDLALTSLQQALKVEEEETLHREFRISREQTTTMESEKPDQLLPGNQKNDLLPANAEFSRKIYLFPESYNALRRELEENYENFFTLVNPEIGMSPAQAMVFNAPAFLGMCNGALDTVIQYDSENVDGICKKLLNGFRNLRGVSPL